MLQLGIDVGGTSVKLAALREGEVVWRGQSPFYAKPTSDQLIAAMRSAIEGEVGDLGAVGICVPGILDRPRRMITLAVNVPGLQGLVLDELVAEALGRRAKRVEILNDAVAGGTDIAATHGLSGRLLCLALGTGVGAAVLDDGVPLFVEGASPGHIGQIDVSLDDHAPIGSDGGAGSLEAYVGLAALRETYGNDVNAALVKMEADSVPIRAPVRAIRICHAMYRPMHVCLIGGVGIRLKHLLGGIRAGVSRNLSSVAREGWTLSAGEHDFHSAIGAGRIAGRA